MARLTLQGCAAAGCPVAGEEEAGLPPPDSEVAPDSVVPLPQMWGPLFAEPEPVPVQREGIGRAAPCWVPGPTRPHPNSHLTSPGLRHRRVLLAELPLMSRRTCSCVSSWTSRRPPRGAAFSSASCLWLCALLCTGPTSPWVTHPGLLPTTRRPSSGL